MSYQVNRMRDLDPARRFATREEADQFVTWVAGLGSTVVESEEPVNAKWVKSAVPSGAGRLVLLPAEAPKA